MNLFGTDGMRNRVGTYPFTTETLPKIGRALALWALEKYGQDARFLVARDPRYSGPWVKAGLMNGLLRYPVSVYDAGILPTPAVFHLMHAESLFSAGIIISASHNPAIDTGIKLVDARTGKITRLEEEQISKLIQSADEPGDFSILGTEIPFPDARKLYKNIVTSFFRKNFLEGKTIVLDCAQGAAAQIAPQIMKELGADVISIHNNPNGYTINYQCGATSPESLQQAVVAHQAFMGFAFDGDADRCIAVTKKGIIKDGDDLLAVLQTHKDYCDEPAIVSTVMANYGLDQHMKTFNKKVIRTAVGDKYVLEALDKENLLLGGEPSGHTILKNHVRTGDGVLVALKILETVEQTGNELLASFIKFPQIVINVPVVHKKDLSQEPFASFLKESKELLTSGRLLVRYSGTEPLVRVLAEGRDQELATRVARSVADYLQSALS